MVESNKKIPYYAEIIKEILDGLDGPIQIDALITKILERRPSQAKNPRQAARQKINEEKGIQLVVLHKEFILPIRLALKDARFRIRLTEEDAANASLSYENTFFNYLLFGTKPEKIIFVDAQENPISSTVAEQRRTSFDPVFGSNKYKTTVVVLEDWFAKNKIEPQDHILVTIKDWENGIFLLEHEPAGKHDPELLEEQNRFLADQIYAMLDAQQNEWIETRFAVPSVYARLSDKNSFIPDHIGSILAQDKRMYKRGWDIQYAESGNFLPESMSAGVSGHRLIDDPPDFSIEEGHKIYRFRAKYVYKTSTWRDIDIRGSQTLTDFDRQLRRSFQYDTFDHLSGFWKRVARGGRSNKRFREIDLAHINPFEETDGSDTAIAALQLEAGDQLKYVYDFGDWIEHRLELKSIGESVTGTTYPCETGRNKPRYEYCCECERKGQKTVALYICLSCSNEDQADVLLCEECLDNHEDCHVEEIVY